MFKDINKKHIEKRALQGLQQKSVATAYIAEF
jgi:hypothetical protein